MSQRLLLALRLDPRMFKKNCVSVSNAVLSLRIARLMQSFSVDEAPTVSASWLDVCSLHCAHMRNYRQ